MSKAMNWNYKLCVIALATMAVLVCACSGPTTFSIENTGKGMFLVSMIEDGKILDSTLLTSKGTTSLSSFKPFSPVLRLKNLESAKVTEFPLVHYGYYKKRGERHLTIRTDGSEFSMSN